LTADWRPQAVEITALTEAMLRTGQVTRVAAAEGLRKIADALRSDYQMSDNELAPISELIAELDRFNGPSTSQTS
jgi:hypothetical protein